MSDPATTALSRATALIQMHRYTEAVPLLAQAIAADPGNPRPRCLLAQCRLALGDAKGALEAASGACAASPESEWGHRLRALALLRLKRRSAALAAAKQAVALAPQEPATYIVLTSAELALHHVAEAGRAARTATSLAPDRPSGHNAMGRVALQARRPAEAEQHFREALSRDPQNVEALNNLGVALLKQGRKSQAVHYFGEASRTDPTFSVARRNATRAAKISIPAILILAGLANQLYETTSGPTTAIVFVVLLGAATAIWLRQRSTAVTHDDPKASKELMKTLRREQGTGRLDLPWVSPVVVVYLGVLDAFVVVAGVLALFIGNAVAGCVAIAVGLVPAAAFLMWRRSRRAHA